MAERQKQFGSAPELRSVWDGATPKFNSLAQGDPGALRQLRAMWDRTEALKAQLQRHFYRYMEVWVAKEAYKEMRKAGITPPDDIRTTALQKGPVPRLALSSQKHLPSASSEDLTVNALMRRARANVRSRMHLRLIKVNSIRTRHFNAIVNNTKDPFLSRRFQQAAEVEKPAPRHIRRRTK